jgi:hypothetical protein
MACIVLVAGTVLGVAVAAGTQGSQSDPLVTLSYLNEKVKPDILAQVDEKLEKKMAELKTQNGAFLSVEVAAGKSLTLSAGTQFLVRGSGFTSTDALVDLTDGTTWKGGGELVQNHLYLATGDGQKVTSKSAATLLVQGSYT